MKQRIYYIYYWNILLLTYFNAHGEKVFHDIWQMVHHLRTLVNTGAHSFASNREAFRHCWNHPAKCFWHSVSVCKTTNGKKTITNVMPEEKKNPRRHGLEWGFTKGARSYAGRTKGRLWQLRWLQSTFRSIYGAVVQGCAAQHSTAQHMEETYNTCSQGKVKGAGGMNQFSALTMPLLLLLPWF